MPPSPAAEPALSPLATASVGKTPKRLPIGTQRLRLRPLRGDDLADLHAILSHPMVSRYDEWEPCTLEESRDDLETALGTPFGTRDEWNVVAVELARSSEMIGLVYLKPGEEPHGQFELGYFFNPDFHGHGYALEAVSTVLALAFAMGAHRVFSRVDPRNAPSLRLLERLDFTREAHFRHSCFCKGEWCDELVYAALAPSP